MKMIITAVLSRLQQSNERGYSATVASIKVSINQIYVHFSPSQKGKYLSELFELKLCLERLQVRLHSLYKHCQSILNVRPILIYLFLLADTLYVLD